MAASRILTYVGASAGAFSIAKLDIDGGTEIGEEIAEAELDSPAPQAQENTGSKRKYRKMNKGAGKAGGSKSYKGGGLSGL